MKKFFYKFFIIFFIIITTFHTFSFCDDIDDEETVNVNAEIISSSTSEEKIIKIPETNSRACVVIDRNTNTILYGKKEYEKRKMASTTKIMTAIVTIENCNLDTSIEVSKKAAGTGGSRLGLKTGDKITIRDLLYGLMLRSGNDCAVCIAEYVGGSLEGFANLMNEKAKSLNLKNTNFETPHGLDSENHYTTAYELALLSNYALKNKVFAQIVGSKNYTIIINGNPKQLTNTNELLGELNGVYGIKTGFTNGANRCLVTACKRDNIDIICVVLGADTKKFRTEDSIKLINFIFNNYKNINLEEIIINEFENWKKANINQFIINKGITQNIELAINDLEYTSLPIRKDLCDNMEVYIDCEKNFEAPVNSNLEIGSVKIQIDDNIILSTSIITNNTINKKSVFSYCSFFLKDLTSILQNSLSF
ncbi:MAG: D-alanyl-D-alanine carboxypeptidase [Clostridia bacterium]|nr:D-alanyl-D-alanine carboxypeptidase [Clostridia bacterium]